MILASASAERLTNASRPTSGLGATATAAKTTPATTSNQSTRFGPPVELAAGALRADTVRADTVFGCRLGRLAAAIARATCGAAGCARLFTGNESQGGGVEARPPLVVAAVDVEQRLELGPAGIDAGAPDQMTAVGRQPSGQLGDVERGRGDDRDRQGQRQECDRAVQRARVSSHSLDVVTRTNEFQERQANA